MKVYIERTVHNQIEQFYEEALLKHDALDKLTIVKKIQRLYDALEALGDYAYIYPLARLKTDWINRGYKRQENLFYTHTAWANVPDGLRH